jgi:hypothetical protein
MESVADRIIHLRRRLDRIMIASVAGCITFGIATCIGWKHHHWNYSVMSVFVYATGIFAALALGTGLWASEMPTNEEMAPILAVDQKSNKPHPNG